MVIARNVEILVAPATKMAQVGGRVPQFVVHLLEDLRLEAGEDLLILLLTAAACLRRWAAGHVLDRLRQADAGAALPLQGENVGKVLVRGTTLLVITDGLANHLICLILALLAATRPTRIICRRFRPIVEFSCHIVCEDVDARPGSPRRPSRIQRGNAAFALDVALLRVGMRRDHGRRVARHGRNGVVCSAILVVAVAPVVRRDCALLLMTSSGSLLLDRGLGT